MYTSAQLLSTIFTLLVQHLVLKNTLFLDSHIYNGFVLVLQLVSSFRRCNVVFVIKKDYFLYIQGYQFKGFFFIKSSGISFQGHFYYDPPLSRNVQSWRGCTNYKNQMCDHLPVGPPCLQSSSGCGEGFPVKISCCLATDWCNQSFTVKNK